MDVIEQADLLVYMEVGEVTKEVKKVDQRAETKSKSHINDDE